MNAPSQSEAREIASRLGVNLASIPIDQFTDGIGVELEHADGSETDVAQGDIEIPAKIAWAHLKEDSQYYTKLARMEGRTGGRAAAAGGGRLSFGSSEEESSEEPSMKTYSASRPMPTATANPAKVHTVMSEFKRGKLHSGGSGKVVRDRKQAIAIALSEARKPKKVKKTKTEKEKKSNQDKPNMAKGNKYGLKKTKRPLPA